MTERCGRYDVCRYCINNPKDTRKCECEDHMHCREGIEWVAVLESGRKLILKVEIEEAKE